jgi:uncharacterized protein (TIGR02266 family)
MKPAEYKGPMPPPPPNRRMEERIEARFEVRFAQEQDAARALRAYSLNLSSGGLCLRTRRVYEVGAQVRLAMVIGGEAFDLDATIAWVRDEAVGVRFLNVKEPDRVRLQRVLESLKK